MLAEVDIAPLPHRGVKVDVHPQNTDGITQAIL